jgi:surfeit locus 1 family protein
MRVPVVPTLIVGIAVAVMIALGVWQLHRADEKNAALAALAGNAAKPPIAYPMLGPVSNAVLFRRSSALCVDVAAWRVVAGRASDGTSGYRRIAECRTGAEGPGLLVDMGVSRDPAAVPAWRGGAVSGVITTEPDRTSVLGRLFGSGPVLRPMLVATTPAPGLIASAPPSVDSIPNNHLSYAVQWFLFAAIAAIIYAVALRRRGSPRR